MDASQLLHMVLQDSKEQISDLSSAPLHPTPKFTPFSIRDILELIQQTHVGSEPKFTREIEGKISVSPC